MHTVSGYSSNDRLRATALQQTSPLAPRSSATARGRRRFDRHGRGLRGPLLSPALPAWQTRRESFYHEVQLALGEMAARVDSVTSVEFGVQEVPSSPPAEWETHDVVLSRVFPRDKKRGLRERIVLYRRPIIQRVRREELPAVVRMILAERISEVLLVSPEDLLGT